MSTKAASFLAFVGMRILTVLVIAGLLRDISGVFRDFVPMLGWCDLSSIRSRV